VREQKSGEEIERYYISDRHDFRWWRMERYMSPADCQYDYVQGVSDEASQCKRAESVQKRRGEWRKDENRVKPRD
jgi:hypothetical protein